MAAVRWVFFVQINTVLPGRTC